MHKKSPVLSNESYFLSGAQDGTWTHTPEGIRTSNVRVYHSTTWAYFAVHGRLVRVPLSSFRSREYGFYRFAKVAHLPFHHLGKNETLFQRNNSKLWGFILNRDFLLNSRMVHPVGFEPTTNGFEDRYSSNWAMGAFFPDWKMLADYSELIEKCKFIFEKIPHFWRIGFASDYASSASAGISTISEGT